MDRCSLCADCQHTTKEHLDSLLVLQTERDQVLGFNADDFVTRVQMKSSMHLDEEYKLIFRRLSDYERGHLEGDISFKSRLKSSWMLGVYRRETEVRIRRLVKQLRSD